MNTAKNREKRTVYQLTLTVLLLLACMILVVGAAWARYRTEEFSFLTYQAKQPDSVSIWSGYDAQTGELTAGESSWTIYNGEGSLQFFISNGTDSDASDENQRVIIRLLSSPTAQELDVRLTVDGEAWDSDATQIAEGTALARSFGPGWMYVFRDDSGKELSWTLNGGEFSVLSARVDVTGLEQQESMTNLFQLQVIGEPSKY